jgi:hypothetical protein
MVASKFGVPYAKLFHKRLEIAKNEQLRRFRGNFDATFSLDDKFKLVIYWWIDYFELSSIIS